MSAVPVRERALRAVTRRFTRFARADGRLGSALATAGIPQTADRYAAGAFLTAAGVTLGALAVALVAALGPLATVPWTWRALLVAAAPLATGAAAFTLLLALPRLARSERGRDIDANLPHGITFLLGLAASGVAPRELFRALAAQKVYGAFADEAAVIVRDVDYLGMDLLTALRHAQDRAASDRFKEFLQGAVSAFGSGVDLATYLRSKSEQFTREEIDEQRRNLDVVSLIAETFLVGVVAAPLFFLVLLSVMSVDNGAGLLEGFLLVLVYMPLAQFGVGFIVKSLNPRVWS